MERNDTMGISAKSEIVNRPPPNLKYPGITPQLHRETLAHPHNLVQFRFGIGRQGDHHFVHLAAGQAVFQFAERAQPRHRQIRQGPVVEKTDHLVAQIRVAPAPYGKN